MSKHYEKRNYGNDSVYFHQKNQCWVAQFNTMIDGQLVRRSASGKTEEEAVKKLAAKKRDILNKKNALKKVTVTFGAEMVKMMKTLKGTVEDKTYNDYEYRHALLKTCSIYDKRLDKIDLAQIQQDINQLTLERDFCVSTCKKVIAFIKRLFRFAVTNRDIGFNPCEAIGCIKVPVYATEEKDVTPLSSEDCAALLELLESNVIIKPVVYCMLFAGLRIAEVLALRWEDIDYKNSVIHIRKAIKRYENKDSAENKSLPKYYFNIGPPKTKAAVRDVPLSLTLKTSLLEWKKLQPKHAKDLTGKNLIFPKQNGKLQDYDSFDAIFRYWLTSVGLEPCTYHTRVVRHTLASYLVKDKVEAKTLQAILGHTDVTTTLQYYIDTDLHSKKDAVNKMDQIVAGIQAFNFELAG